MGLSAPVCFLLPPAPPTDAAADDGDAYNSDEGAPRSEVSAPILRSFAAHTNRNLPLHKRPRPPSDHCPSDYLPPTIVPLTSVPL